jgi:alginate O-acetyltransferase complex protein AlgI
MVFNSIHYLFFISVVFVLYFLLPAKQRWKLLLAASVYFYCSFDIKFLVLIAFSIFTSFFLAIKSEETADESKKKLYLHLAIWSSALILAVFKYYNFFAESGTEMFAAMGIAVSPLLIKIGLPIGLSFYTFQIIGYSLDVYYGVSKAERKLGIYSLYILFFPKLIAGPIEQSQNLLPQLHKEQNFDYNRITSGIKLIAWGLFKKVCIADRLSVFVDMVFSSPEQYSGLQSIIACYFLVFMVYTDFSGYTDMAVGAARIFGFNLIRNFNRPFISQNLTEFWKRWHISLYSWCYEYIYNPLSFNYRSWKQWGIILAIFATLTFSGLWHGAALTFILYGVLHAIGLTAEYFLTPFRTKIKNALPSLFYKYVSIAITFHFFLFTLIIFKADSLSEAFYIIESFTKLNISQFGLYLFGDYKIEFLLSFAFVFVLLAMEYWQSKTDNYLSFHLKLPSFIRWSAYALVILIVVYFGVIKSNEFVYAQF